MKNSYVDLIHDLYFIVTQTRVTVVTDKMAHKPKALVAFAEDLGSVSSKHPQDGS